MEQSIFKFFTDYRGHHWKGITIYNNTEINLQYLFCFNIDSDKRSSLLGPIPKLRRVWNNTNMAPSIYKIYKYFDDFIKFS